MRALPICAVIEVWTEDGLDKAPLGWVLQSGAEGSKLGHLGLFLALPFIGLVPLGKLLRL